MKDKPIMNSQEGARFHHFGYLIMSTKYVKIWPEISHFDKKNYAGSCASCIINFTCRVNWEHFYHFATLQCSTYSFISEDNYGPIYRMVISRAGDDL